MQSQQFLILFLFHLVQQTSSTIVIEYYEIKPYIFTDPKTGHLTGMLVDTFTEVNNLAVSYCNTSEPHTFIKSSYDQVHEKWKQATNPMAQRMSPLNRYLFPIVKEHIANGTKNPIYSSETISVITKKYWVEGSLKFFISLFDLQVLFLLIFVIVFLLAWILFVTVSSTFYILSEEILFTLICYI